MIAVVVDVVISADAVAVLLFAVVAVVAVKNPRQPDSYFTRKSVITKNIAENAAMNNSTNSSKRQHHSE